MIWWMSQPCSKLCSYYGYCMPLVLVYGTDATCMPTSTTRILYAYTIHTCLLYTHAYCCISVVYYCIFHVDRGILSYAPPKCSCCDIVSYLQGYHSEEKLEAGFLLVKKYWMLKSWKGTLLDRSPASPPCAASTFMMAVANRLAASRRRWSCTGAGKWPRDLNGWWRTLPRKCTDRQT